MTDGISHYKSDFAIRDDGAPRTGKDICKKNFKTQFTCDAHLNISPSSPFVKQLNVCARRHLSFNYYLSFESVEYPRRFEEVNNSRIIEWTSNRISRVRSKSVGVLELKPRWPVQGSSRSRRWDVLNESRREPRVSSRRASLYGLHPNNP